LERYEGINFRKKNFRAHLSSEPFSWLNASISFSLGDGIYYSEDPYLGYKISRGGWLTLKPLSNLRLFYNFKNEKFFKSRGGEKVYTINIISQRISYQLSRPLSRPGTVFYFGIEDNQEKDDSGIFRVTGRYYFIKFSYWWRM